MNTTEADLERENHFRQLRWALQELALSGSGQPLLFPDYTANAAGLATAFDHWSAVVRTNHDAELSAAQRGALAAIEGKFAGMARDGARFDVEIWTETALRTSEDWRELRQLAAAALATFDWPLELPTRGATVEEE